MSTVTVRKHTRRRVGKTATVAMKLGFGSNMNVEPYRRRRPVNPQRGETWVDREDPVAFAIVLRVADNTVFYKIATPLGTSQTVSMHAADFRRGWRRIS